MNKFLIEDEGHRNPMSVDELAVRMRDWMKGEYTAYVFRADNANVGYCLFKDTHEYVYIRQFFIQRDKRRCGYGQSAMNRLMKEVWPRGKALRLDVLVTNYAGVQFWRRCGFEDYCLTMEHSHS
jgi:GNAT superfamily N-acetyltransferase